MKVDYSRYLGTLLIVLATSVHAQSTSVDPYEEFGKHLRAAQEIAPLKSDLFGEQVSLYNGATEFDLIDIDLPGNSRLAVQLRRRLIIEDRRFDPGRIAGMGDWDVDVPYIEGVFTQKDGWVVEGELGSKSVARCSVPSLPFIWYPMSTGSNSAFAEQVWDGNQVHIPGILDEEMLKNTEAKLPAVADGHAYPWVTKSYYRVGCLPTAHGMPGESFYALAPNGEKYTFDWTIQRVAPRLRTPVDQLDTSFTGYDRFRVFLLATRVEDRFGNWVSYTYSGDHLTSITANDGREIDLTWSGNTVINAKAGDHTWSYSYNGSGQLVSVVRPDNSMWSYAVKSGSLQTIKTLIGEPPQLSHCQSEQDIFPNSGTFVYSIDAPSGAHGEFTFQYQRHGRTGVPYSCLDGNPDHAYPAAYVFFDNFTINKKQISGAGLVPLNWTYNYPIGDSYCEGRCYYTASGPYNGNVETYIPSGSCTTCLSTETVTVTEPSDVMKYTFGISYGNNEGRLLQTETDSPAGQVLRTVANSYLAEDQVANQAFPPNVGQSLLFNWKNPMVGRLRPAIATITAQGGDTYTGQNEAFDAFTQITKTKRFSGSSSQCTAASAQCIEETTNYRNDPSLWVLGLPLTVTNIATGDIESADTYNPADDTLLTRSAFGELRMTYTFNSAGQLASFNDGNAAGVGHTTSLSNYKRGIPQLISYPDQHSESLVVDDLGQISSLTDQAGHTTSYSYDGVGRIKEIDYPTGDEQSWYPEKFSYDFVASTERGLSANHWRRTTSANNTTLSTTYFDAMLRPVLSDTNIGSSVVASTLTNYDAKGQTVYSSYPSGSALSFTLTPTTKGARATYDALERITKVQQDSELGTLTSTTQYLSGAGQTVTDPNGKVTTTNYQVFDTPSYDAPIKVVAPTGITQLIARDVYGSPTSITQSGSDGASGTVSLSKSMVYDIYHRLCRTTEPESGDTVIAYDGANNIRFSVSGFTVPVGSSACGKETVPTIAQTTFTYDAMNRVQTIAPPAGTQPTSYVYDALGNVAWASSGPAIWENHYNFRGMMTDETLHMVGTDARLVSYHHDAYGNLSSVVYPGATPGSAGESVLFVPDALGRPTQATSTVATYASGVQYYPNGQVKQFAYGNGALYVADQNDRQLMSNFSYGAGATALLSEDLTYDANGNITNVNDLVNGARTKTFHYDDLNRLKDATSTLWGGTESYTYDALNNLRTRNAPSQSMSYIYDTSNLLRSITRSGGIPASTFNYDTQGNQILRNGLTLQFDKKNQLLGIADQSGNQQDSYQYDANGRRVRKTPAGGTFANATFSFYNHAGQMLYQYEPAAAKATNFIYLGTRMVGDDENVVLGAPDGISFDSNPNNGSYTVSWGTVASATSYLLQEQVNGGAWTTVYSGSAASTALSGRVGATYVYRVAGCIGANCGAFTGSATLGVRPTLPVVTVPTGTINGTYTVSWIAPISASAYMVQESLNGGAWTTIVSSTPSTSVSRPGTTSGSYTYQVAAYNNYGTRGWSATSAPVTVDTSYGVVPSAPATLTVPATSNSGNATLSWSAATLATRYVVEQSSNGGTSWTGIYNSAGTTTALSGLADGSYVFHVQACSTYGCSPWTGGSTTLVVAHVPNAPASITVPATSSGSVAVSWSASTGATGYVLQHRMGSGGWSPAYSGAATSSTVSEGTSGSYTYQVQAINSHGGSAYVISSAVTVTIPPATAPTLTVPATNATGSYTVSWSAVTAATSYMLQEQVNGGAWTTIQATAATSKAISGKATGNYGYRVEACNIGGCSAWSGTSTAVVALAPAAPTSVQVITENGSPTRFLGTWATVSGATRYEIFSSQTNGIIYSGTQTSFIIETVAVGGGRHYMEEVRACNASACSAYVVFPN